MILKKISLALFLPSVLVACSSHQPSSFYQLKAIETSNIRQTLSPNQEITILLTKIKFPEYLDRPQMVIRDNDIKLQLSEYHRWAEPLKNEFSRVLIENLNKQLVPGNAVQYADLNGVEPSLSLSVEVLQLDVNTDNQAILIVKWAYWLENSTKNINRLTSKYKVAFSNTGYQAKVKAQSQAIALFSTELVNTLNSALKTQN